MADEIIISQLVDRNGLKSDEKELIETANRIYQAYAKLQEMLKTIGTIKPGPDMAGPIKELNELNRELARTTKELYDTKKRLAEMETQLAKASRTATQESVSGMKEQVTWLQYVKENMSRAMREAGSHGAAMKQLGDEYRVLKTSATSAGDAIRTLGDAGAVTAGVGVEKQVGAFEQLKAEVKQADIAFKNLVVSQGAESQEAQEAAAKLAMLRDRLREVSDASKNAGKPAVQPTVSTDNIADVEAERQRTLKATGTAVSELEQQEAQAANSAVLFASSQQASAGALTEAEQSVLQMVGSLDAFTGSIGENIRLQLENTASLAKNKAEQKELLSSISSTGVATQSQTDKLVRLKAEETLLAENIRTMSLTIKNQARDFNAVEGSIDELRAKVTLLQRAYASLGESEKNSAFGQAISGKLSVMEPALKQAEAKIGQFQRNVGNYSSAVVNVFQTAFGQLRTLAYIIPGLGIAGIIGLVTDGLVELVGGLIKGEDASLKFSEAQKTLTDSLKATNDVIKKQVDAIAEDRRAQLEALQKDVDLAEKSGQNQSRLFALKKTVASEQNKLTQEQIDLTIKAAEKESVNVSNGIKGINALKTARENAFILYRAGLNEVTNAQNEYDALIQKGNNADKDDVEKAQKKVANAQSNFNSYKSIYDNYTSTLDNATKAQNRIDELRTEEEKYNADERRKLLLESAKIETSLVVSKNNTILADERSTLEQRILATNTILAQRKRMIEAEKQNVLSNPSSSSVDRINAEKKAAADLVMATEDARTRREKINKDFDLRETEARKAILIQQAQFESQQADELSKEQELTLAGRLEQIRRYAAEQKKIIDDDYEAQRKKDSYQALTPQEKLQREKDYENKVLLLNVDINKRITENLRTEIDKRKELQAEGLADIERAYSSIDLGTSQQYAEDVIALNKSLAEKKISLREYDKERRRLDNAYRIESIRATEAMLRAELNAFDGAETFLREQERILEDLRAKLSASTSDDEKKQLTADITTQKKKVNNAKEAVDKKIQLAKQLTNVEKDESDTQSKNDQQDQNDRLTSFKKFVESATAYADQLVNLFAGLGNAGSETALNQIKAEQDALEERYNKEKELINQSVLSAADKQKKLEELDRKHAAQQKILADKERAEKNRQAEADKRATLFKIALATARAVVEALPNIPLSILAGVTGAVEFAVAAATPVPKYFRGKNAADTYQGPAIVGDGGKSELILREDGRMEVTPRVPTMTWVDSKDIILPDAEEALRTIPLEETNRVLAYSVAMQHQPDNSKKIVDGVSHSIERLGGRLERVVRNIPQPVIRAVDPIREWVHNGGSTKFLNS